MSTTGISCFVVGGVFVHADHHLLARVDLLLEAVGRIGDLHLGEPLVDRGRHPAHRVDLFDVLPGLLLHLVRQGLHEIGAGQGVDRVGDAGLLGDDLLRPERDLHGMIGGEAEDLVEGVGVERLGAAEDRGERLDRRPDDVVVGLLGGERAARRLGVETHPPGAGILRVEAVAHDLRPDPPGRAHLADLLEEVDVGVEEEGEPRGEVVDVEPLAADDVLDVFDPVAEREGQLLDGRGAGLPDVVAADADRVPLRDVPRAELDGVADQPHRRLRRAHEGLLGDELLEHVVLDRPADLPSAAPPCSPPPRSTSPRGRWRGD